MTVAAIEVRDLRTVRGGNVVHEVLDLDVREGETLAVVGGSESGKTTLLRLMLGLEVPDGCEVRILGHPLGACARQDLEQVRHRRGVLFQLGALFSALPVFDNVALPLRELRLFPRDVVRAMAMFALSVVGIGPEHAQKMPATLSGGMVKRVALARAIVLSPALLFLDEPTAGLDPESAKSFVRHPPPAAPLVQSLGQAARSIDRAAAQWADQPQSLIFGRSPPRPGPGEAGFDASLGTR